MVDEDFPYWYSILSWKGRVWQGWDLFLIHTGSILGYPTSGKAELMADFNEISNKKDQCSRNNEGTDSEERQVIFCGEMKREEWHDVSLQMWFFSDTLRPARERTGNCLTSVYMSDKTRKTVLRRIVHVHHTVWTVVAIFNGKDNEVLEYMS